MKVAKKIIIYSLVCMLAFSPCVIACSMPVNASLVDSWNELKQTALDVGTNVIKNGINTVGNYVNTTVWRPINTALQLVNNQLDKLVSPKREVCTPTSTTPVNTTYNVHNGDNDWSVNVYKVNDSNNTTNNTSYNFNNNSSTVYDLSSHDIEFVDNSETYYTTDNDYKTYSYVVNDSRAYVTETYNSVIYTYVNPSTNTVDCYVCGFVLPSGDESFNYSADYCFGLYWVYNVYNYDYQIDDSSVLALFRLDGDLHNEVPNSKYHIGYNPQSFGDGKFGSAMRCDGVYNMCIYKTNLSNTQYESMGDITVSCWYFNGDPNYKAMSQGWHYLVWEWVDDVKHLWIDGVKSGVSTFSHAILFAEDDQLATGTYRYDTELHDIKFLRQGRLNNVLQVYDCYHPFDDSHLYGVNGSSVTKTYDFIANAFHELGFRTGNNISRNNSSNYENYGYGMNCPAPLHYPPLKIADDTIIYFPYTGTGSLCIENVPVFGVGRVSNDSATVTVSSPTANANIQRGTTIISKDSSNRNTYFVTGTPKVEMLRMIQNTSGGTIGNLGNGIKGYSRNLESPTNNSHTGFSLSYSWNNGGNTVNVASQIPFYTMTKYDLSGCYFDEILITDGQRYDTSLSWISTPVSRQELEVSYVAPGTNLHFGDIGIQSTTPVSSYRIGGTIPTISKQGMVWFKLENGVCTSCVQYVDGSWQKRNFGVYDTVSWKNGYTFDFNRLTFSDVDADIGSMSGNVYNNYVTNINNYIDSYGSETEKKDIFAFGTFVYGVIGALFSFFTGFVSLGFLPSWVLFPITGLLGFVTVLILAKISGIFKK